MASLKEVAMSALLEEMVSRSTTLAFIGTFTLEGEEREMGIVHGDLKINYYNLGLLQSDILSGTFDESDGEDEEESEWQRY